MLDRHHAGIMDRLRRNAQVEMLARRFGSNACLYPHYCAKQYLKAQVCRSRHFDKNLGNPRRCCVRYLFGQTLNSGKPIAHEGADMQTFVITNTSE